MKVAIWPCTTLYPMEISILYPSYLIQKFVILINRIRLVIQVLCWYHWLKSDLGHTPVSYVGSSNWMMLTWCFCFQDGRTALKIAIEAGHRHVGVLLYAYQRNIQGLHDKKKSKPASPKTPSSALPLRSSYFTTK